MQQITTEQFAQAMGQADPNTKALMGSSVIHNCLSNSQQDPQIAETLLLPFGYFYLGIINEETLKSEISNSGLENPPDFIKKIVTCVNAAESAPPAAQEIPVPPTDIVTPVRTMADDMQAAGGEQTYSSNQDALIQPPAPAPVPPPPQQAPQIPKPPTPPVPPPPAPENPPTQ